ncbi:FAD-dependent oxidoreductase [Trebonia kvetii]|uniref:FAD-dependent oxidoreductase n=1 Tax=Trebonia kvetii TaxID=2480626 RepID=A0A6P2BSY2_9ACTN|nr:FAD-dependent oxidoreductase [Trebonia kvetii]TVZ02172.1 FAD-dependent oxidoreductase [Trebonia kvetii]
MAGQAGSETVDIVVAGAGAAGCAAAIAAHDEGASVLLLEKMPTEEAGGNTRVSGGAWFDNRDAERAAVYLRSLCGDRPLPETVVRTWARETRHVSSWIESLGAVVAPNGDYKPEYPELDGSDCYGGYRCVDGELGAGRLYDVLSKAVGKRDIDVRYDTPARRLVRSPETGAVTGIVAGHDAEQQITARGGVILATGGFEADPEMVRTYLGLADPPLWGSLAATGDGHRMAMRAGADLWHMDNMMAVNGVAPPGSRHGFFAMFIYASGFLWVAPDGTRFVNETPQTGHGQARLHGSYELFPRLPMHVIFDERTRLAGPISPDADVMAVGWQVLMNGYRWSADNTAEIASGWIHRADTPAALAAALGVPADQLTATIDRYNAACAAGRDDAFGRPAKTLVPVDQPPFYAYTAKPMLAWTNGGPRRDEHARVLDPDGAAIAGLYAAGTVSSTYSWCKDGGFHIADAIAFGRIAGRHAANRRSELSPHSQRPPRSEPKASEEGATESSTSAPATCGRSRRTVRALAAGTRSRPLQCLRGRRRLPARARRPSGPDHSRDPRPVRRIESP